MSVPTHRHSRPPGMRPSSIERDVEILHRATELITELGAELDVRLLGEDRTSERLRLVREATNRITRAANDAIQAYRRARRLLEMRQPAAGRDDADERLASARLGMLRALEIAGRRYPWTGDAGSASATTRPPRPTA